MKKNRNKIKKIILAAFLVFEVAFFNFGINGVAADLADMDPDDAAEEAAEELEGRYNINLESTRDIMQQMNVTGNKAPVPEVMVTFEPSDPKPGEKVTAHASPMYFSNPSEELYYTWYFKPAGSPSNENCDKKIVELYKVNAMRIVANGGFDYGQVDYDDFKDILSDDDGYMATFGGHNKYEGSNGHCYIHDFETGENYELFKWTYDYVKDPMVGIYCNNEGKKGVCAKNIGEIEEEKCEMYSGKPCEKNPFCISERYFSAPRCPSGWEPYCMDKSFRREQIIEGSCEDLSSGIPHSLNDWEFDYDELGCNHLFPKSYGATGTGDGSFTLEEEEFWQTNPGDSDTADNGNLDEANVVGLGQSSFTWNYQDGDEIGVVVEGTSMIPTKYDDSTYMVMWAFPKNECKPKNTDILQLEERDDESWQVEIPTARMDLDECLCDNFIDPKEKNFQKLEVTLSYSPDNPINDPSEGNSGDTLSVQSSLASGEVDFSSLNYDWQVQIGNGPDFIGGFKTITGKLIEAGLMESSQGNGLDSLSVQLNLNSTNIGESNYKNYLSDGEAYLKIKLEVTDPITVRSGKSDVIVKIISTDEKIQAHKVKVGDDGKLSFDDDICTGEEEGEEGALERQICFVANNDIIGVDFPDGDYSNFSWTLDGKPLVCDDSISSGCSTANSNANFFPVSGEAGKTYTVGLTATEEGDADEAKNTIQLSRIFKIVEPYVEIVSNDEVDKDSIWRRYLGKYITLSGESKDDFSENVFEAYSYSNIALKAKFHPFWVEDSYSNMSWWLNGIKEKEGAEDPTAFNFEAAGLPGDSFNVAFNAFYDYSEERQKIRKALYDIWKISSFDSASQGNLSSAIQIELVEPERIAKANQAKKWVAAIFSNTPSNIFFMIRTVLTIFLVLAGSFLVSSLRPGNIL